MSALTDRFDGVLERLSAAVAASGRAPESVRLTAVSKTHGPDAVAEIAAHWHCRGGRPLFGESYMQEARDKMPAVAALLAGAAPGFVPEWHFVGRVQSNKAKDVTGRFALIHSVGSLKLAGEMHKAWQSRVAGALVGLDAPAPAPQDVLVQVNVGREAQKAGVDPEALEALLLGMRNLPGLRVRGLMCLPPLQQIGEHSRPYFAMLRELRDAVEKRCGLELPELSMGMSDDFEAAIEEGATLVRIGTDIFGARQ